MKTKTKTKKKNSSQLKKLEAPDKSKWNYNGELRSWPAGSWNSKKNEK